MSEETKYVCPGCGTSLTTAINLDSAGLCESCASGVTFVLNQETVVSQGRLPNNADIRDVDPDETIVPESQPSHDLADQTMSIASGTKPSTPGEPKSTVYQIGRFRVLRMVGTGGFGTVFKAHDTLLDRVVALKVPRCEVDDRTNELFLHEAKAAARLRHPNIVAIFETGIADEQPYIASEYVDGKTLSEIMKLGRVQERQVVEIVKQISEAIHYAHSEGIVHRDIKPANIMMGRGARPQIMDFGLARLGSDPDASIVAEGSIVGTPTYMAPEQARGDKNLVGPKSDQYSVAVLLYYMLTGRQPYRGEPWSIVSQVADPDIVPKPPRKIRKNIPRDLEACCVKAMENDPNRRYDSLESFASDLENWLEGRPLIARPVSATERFTRWCGRNRIIASLLGAISLLLLTALIVGYVLAFKFSTLANYANDRADAEKKAKRRVERVLIDTLTESGLDAGRNGQNQEAVLWFGSAAAQADDHPHRQKMNRVRFQNWLSETPIPVRMFPGLGHWHKTLMVHPSGDYVASEEREPSGDQCRIWNLKTGKQWEIPWDVAISAAAWNAQGDQIAVGSSTEVRIYSFPDGEELWQWYHDSYVHELAFSKTKAMIAIGGDHTFAIRDLSQKDRSKSVSTSGTAEAFSWSPSSDKCAVLTRDHTVNVYSGNADADDVEPMLSAIACPYESEHPRIVFVNDDLLVVPESSKAIRCWDTTTGKEAWAVPCGPDANVDLAADGKRLAILNREFVIQVDPMTGDSVGAVLKHPNLLYDVRFSPDSKQLLTACSDQLARVYDVDSGERLHVLRHGDIVHRVAWMPSSTACVSAHWKADLIRVWKLGETNSRSFTRSLPSSVMHARWSSDGKWLMPTGMDLFRGAGAPVVLNAADGSAARQLEFPGRTSDACFVTKSNTVVMGGSASPGEQIEDADRFAKQDFSAQGLLVGVDHQTGEPVFPAIDTDSAVIAVVAHPSKPVIAALCHDRQLLIVDAKSGDVLHRQQTFAGTEFFYGFVVYRRLAFSPDGNSIAVWGSRSRTAEIRSAIDGELVRKITHPGETSVDWLHDVVFSPDGKIVATCSADQTVRLWKTDDGKMMSSLQHSGWIFSAVFSSDGKQLLTACQDRQARLWEVQNPGKPVLVTPAQSDEVYGVCFLPGDKTFLLGLRNGEVNAWDVDQGKMISPSVAEPDQGAVYTISLSPNLSRVAVVSRDKKIRCYEPARWQPSGEGSLSNDDIQALGEIVAARELHSGVLTGLSNQEVLGRWTEFYQTHSGHSIFVWPSKTGGAIGVGDQVEPIKASGSDKATQE